ncbi:MAG: hypothetical protein NT087_03210 [Deltaproteobacteria bacterium]|nr:hypothetical protein [Deltaproteobacteria bacterium]
MAKDNTKDPATEAAEKEAAEKAAAEAAEKEAAESGLVAMAKEGETLEVHPTCVDAHLAAGWDVVEVAE